MKIDPKMIAGAASPQALKPQKAARGTFEEILNGVQASSVQGSAPAGGPIPAASLSPVAIRAMSAGEEALDALQRYRDALADPSVSPRDLEPMVEGLGALKTKVDDAASFMSEGDPLKGIMEEVSGVLGAEVARFRRGELTG
jgi:hypothetical protein